MKETRPDLCPKARVLDLVAEYLASGGSHKTWLLSTAIHSSCRDTPQPMLDEQGIGLPQLDWILNDPRLVLRLDPFCENSSSMTQPLVLRISVKSPVAGSQSRTVLSSEPDANSWPLGEKATDLIQSVWPLSVCWRVPVAGSQSCIILSSEPDASSWPSGEKATDWTEAVWPSSTCNSALQFSWTCGNWQIHFGWSDWNISQIIAAQGVNTSPAQ